MRYCILIIGFICEINNISYGQIIRELLFDEFTLSANRTFFSGNNTEGKYGFGLGAYNSFRSDKKLNVLVGFEYNQSNFFVNYSYDGHYAYYYDLSYKLNSISIPLGLRYNLGPKQSFFFESGVFVDLVINSSRKGTHVYYYDPQVISESEIDETDVLSNSLGSYFGIGILIPISKYKFIVKSDYKCGFNKWYTNSLDDEEVIHNNCVNIRIGLKIN